jgi:hypothetical protein
VAVHVVVADDVLFDIHDEAAHLDGCGPIPAELARELTAVATDDSLAQLRRLYLTPGTGDLVAADSRSRRFPDGLAQLIRLRDQTCRTPRCDAPIRHLDHAHDAAQLGPTSQAKGQGLCEACNRAEQAPRSARPTRPRSPPPDRDHLALGPHPPLHRAAAAPSSHRRRLAGRPRRLSSPEGVAR